MQSNLTLMLALSCLLGACALESKRIEPPQTRVIVQPAPQSEADQLLAYLAQARKLGAQEFAIERESVRNALQQQKTEFNRVKLALLLAIATPSPAQPGLTANANDDVELIALLEPVVQSANASVSDSVAPAGKAETQALATLMYSMAQDRKKLRDQWRDVQARLNALRRDDSKASEARSLRAQVEELERQLGALKSIDRSVNRRTETLRPEATRLEPPK